MTSMLSVIIPRDLIIVPVSLVTLEMEVIVLVILCSYSLFVSLHMIEAYTSRLNFVIEIKSYCDEDEILTLGAFLHRY